MDLKRTLFISSILLVLILSIVIQPLLVTDKDTYSTILEDGVPLGAIPPIVKMYASGYGVTWTQDPSVDATTYSGKVNNADVAKITLIGNTSETPALIGLTREAAEKVLGSPLTTYGNVRISALNSSSKAYYQFDQDLMILYYDTETPSKVLFTLRINKDLATKTRFFTSLKLDPLALPDTETMTFELLNAVRVAYGKTPLTPDQKIATVSRNHSKSMATGNYFSHDNTSGQGPKERLKASNIPFKNYGEVLTAGTWTPMDALASWMNSPPHRAIILGDFTSGGVGIATGESTFGIYYTLKLVKN